MKYLLKAMPKVRKRPEEINMNKLIAEFKVPIILQKEVPTFTENNVPAWTETSLPKGHTNDQQINEMILNIISY